MDEMSELESARPVHPLLSICISTFNRANFIGETLDSIVNQLDPSIELIVVDGCSPDNTELVMSEYIERHPQVIYIREDVNSGVDKDYDKAVGYANGEYCWLMTDDDLLAPGSISHVCAALNGTTDLVVVNSEVWNHDFSNQLQPSRLPYTEDKLYGLDSQSDFFSEVSDCLSFIGGVIIRRETWLSRDRSAYYGTLFVHVGVIFQNPQLEQVRVIATPLIRIRYGNAMWSSRGFEIWMFKWPGLIWAFNGFSDDAKKQICSREPWKNVRTLVLYRGIGGFGISEYRKFLTSTATGMSRLIALAIAVSPGWLVNSMACLYCLIFNRKARSGVYDLSRSVHSTWVSRWVARVMGVYN